MLTFSEANSGLNDDPTSMEGSQNWSIYKTTTAVLSDSVSLYDPEFFPQSEMDFNSVYETPQKVIKTESITDLMPVDTQHYGEWESKYIDHWTSQDCLFWLIHQLQDLKVGQNLPLIRMERLAHIDGIALKQFSVEDFNRMFPDYGLDLFNRLQRFRATTGMCDSLYSFDNWNSNLYRANEPLVRYPSPLEDSHMLTDLDSNEEPLPPLSSSVSPYSSQESESGYKSDSSAETTTTEPPPPPEKRRPGRPRGTRKKKKPEKLGRLWEFIRDLLLNPMYNPSLICWENYDEGTFRFVHSDRVAKLWGSKKDNIDMNYEKLSRAMRYYYKSQVLLPVYGKRLVYKFGPTATGWRSERPIFRQG